MAETYHVLDIRALSVKLLATLCAGLPEGSRVKRSLSDAPASLDTLLLASIADNLRWLVWSKTKAGRKGRNAPASILNRLYESKEKKTSDSPEVFSSPEAFEAARARIIRGSDNMADGTTIATAYVQIVPSTKQLDSGSLSEALGGEKAAKDTGIKLGETIGKNLGPAIQKMSLAAGGLGAALLGNAYNAAKSADDLNTLAKQYGVSTAEIQKMNYAQDLIDVSTETMLASISRLTREIGSGNAAFDQLGVSITNADGTMRSSSEVWYDTLEALSQIRNETERDTLTMELFGRSGMELAGIVDDGGAALKALGEEAAATGSILGQDALNDANAFNDAIDRMKVQASAAFMEAGATLAEHLMPALEKLIEVVMKVIKWFGDLDGTTQTVILTILGVVAAIGPLMSAISALSNPVNLIIMAVGALIAIGVALVKNWDVIKERAGEIWGNIKTSVVGFIENTWGKIQTFAGNIKDKIINLSDTIKGRFDVLKVKIQNVWERIKNAIVTPIQNARDKIKEAIDKVKEFFSGLKLELPHIKLPHFSLVGEFSLLPPSVPRLSVDWYDKGGIFRSPSVIGVGEKRPEFVGALDDLRDIVREEAGGKTEISMNIYGTEGQNINELADRVMDRLQFAIDRKERQFA